LTSWTQLGEFISNGLMPAFGSNPFIAGGFLLISFFALLAVSGAGLETSIAVISGVVILTISTTNLLPQSIGYVVILVLLIPFYWALRGIFSR
jgi:hypothetical protein